MLHVRQLIPPRENEEVMNMLRWEAAGRAQIILTGSTGLAQLSGRRLQPGLMGTAPTKKRLLNHAKVIYGED